MLTEEVKAKADKAAKAVKELLGEDVCYCGFLPKANQPFVYVAYLEMASRVPLHRDEICKSDDVELKALLAKRTIRALRDMKIDINKKIKVLTQTGERL